MWEVMTKLNWITLSGPDLPEPLYGAAVVAHEDSFIVVGGDTGNYVYSDKVMQMKRDMRWEERRDMKLDEPKVYATAMIISKQQ